MEIKEPPFNVVTSGRRPIQYSSQNATTPFSDQFWTICMHFGKSAANFDIAAAESYPTGRRTDKTPKLPALFPKCMHCRLNWPEKGVYARPGDTNLKSKEEVGPGDLEKIKMYILTYISDASTMTDPRHLAQAVFFFWSLIWTAGT